jgi:hypothetical protein
MFATVLSWVQRHPRTSSVIAAAVFLDLVVGVFLAGLMLDKLSARIGGEVMNPDAFLIQRPADGALVRGSY